MKGSKEEIKAIDLRSDYKVNPIGIHNVAPRLSWRMTAYGKNRKQSAYQIQVFKKESDIKEVLVWDSEKVYSGESVNIPYKGKQLASRERVYWKVRIWDEKENVSEWSEEAFFEAGLLNKTDWEAEWICAPEKAAAVYFRKVCNIEKQPKSGRLYISGLGYYEAYLNGKKCGEDVLTPNRTHYTERVFYHTYDITTAVVHGENVFGVELGNGWYNQKDKINEKKLWYGYPKLLFQIEIEYADGDKDVFISDENTKWHESPRIYNNIYFGEIYDARKESIGWREKDFEDLDWKFAGKAEKPGGELTKQKAPSDQKICELFPKKISEVTPGMYVIDFGQNMTGWVKMRVSGKEGDKVQLRFGEELWPDGKINYYSTGSGWKQQKDIYILSGKKEEYYEPAFTWHGFRYVEVQGYPGIPKREDFVAVHIRAGVERSGKFICSNALINQIQKARIGIIGCGGIATGKHLSALKSNGDLCEVVAFCDGILDRAKKAAQEYGVENAQVCQNYNELLANPNVDVVYVLTPNISHSPIAVDAFHAGKHVMCEKPMAINTAEAEKMMTAWKESGKKFSIGYQNRYRADVRHLRSACQNGDLGEIYYAKAYAIRRRGVPTWGSFIQGSQQGGGPLIDIGTHSLDLALWLMDNYDVESVTGTVFKKLGKLPQATDGNLWGAWDTSKYDVEDSAIGYIKMKSGALVVLESSWALNILEAREAEVTLCGTKAGAELRNQKEVIYNRGKYGRLTEEVLTPGEPHDFFGTRYDAPYLEAKEWLTAILEDRDPLVRPEQSLVVTQVLDAIYESAAKNETVWF